MRYSLRTDVDEYCQAVCTAGTSSYTSLLVSNSRSTLPSQTGNMAAKWDARLSHPVPHDTAYYGKCMIGGILSCGLTHTAITPLDVVKCNMQVDPARFKSLPQGLSLIAKSEGMCLFLAGFIRTSDDNFANANPSIPM